jgi:hypothetical protein
MNMAERVTTCIRMTIRGVLINIGALGPAEALRDNCLRYSKLRHRRMPNAQAGGRMIRQEGQMAHREEGIDEMILEEFIVRRCCEYVTVPESRQSLEDKLIIQEEGQTKDKVETESEGLGL